MPNILKDKKNLILLIIAALNLLLFLKILDSVIEQGRVTLFDTQIANLILTIRTPLLNDVMIFITQFGNSLIVAIVSIALIIGLLMEKKFKYIILFILVELIDMIFVLATKAIIGRERPQPIYALISENNFSFPSGHALFAVCYYGLALFFLVKVIHNRTLKYITGICGIIFITLIGFSRIYLGVHWTSDVIASIAMGVCWLSVIFIFLRPHSK